jgi:hypothetical protein
VKQEAVLLAGSRGLGHEMMARSCIALLDGSAWRRRAAHRVRKQVNALTRRASTHNLCVIS